MAKPKRRRVPWFGNPKVAKQNAKRWRLIRAGLAPHMTKQQMRKLIATHTETSLPRGSS